MDFQLIQDGLTYVQLHEDTLFSFIQIEFHDWPADPDRPKFKEWLDRVIFEYDEIKKHVNQTKEWCDHPDCL